MRIEIRWARPRTRGKRPQSKRARVRHELEARALRKRRQPRSGSRGSDPGAHMNLGGRRDEVPCARSDGEKRRRGAKSPARPPSPSPRSRRSEVRKQEASPSRPRTPRPGGVAETGEPKGGNAFAAYAKRRPRPDRSPGDESEPEIAPSEYRMRRRADLERAALRLRLHRAGRAGGALAAQTLAGSRAASRPRWGSAKLAGLREQDDGVRSGCSGIRCGGAPGVRRRRARAHHNGQLVRYRGGACRRAAVAARARNGVGSTAAGITCVTRGVQVRRDVLRETRPGPRVEPDEEDARPDVGSPSWSASTAARRNRARAAPTKCGAAARPAGNASGLRGR